jgi:hypothetical protein
VNTKRNYFAPHPNLEIVPILIDNRRGDGQTIMELVWAERCSPPLSGRRLAAKRAGSLVRCRGCPLGSICRQKMHHISSAMRAAVDQTSARNGLTTDQSSSSSDSCLKCSGSGLSCIKKDSVPQNENPRENQISQGIRIVQANLSGEDRIRTRRRVLPTLRFSKAVDIEEWDIFCRHKLLNCNHFR